MCVFFSSILDNQVDILWKIWSSSETYPVVIPSERTVKASPRVKWSVFPSVVQFFCIMFQKIFCQSAPPRLFSSYKGVLHAKVARIQCISSFVSIALGFYVCEVPKQTCVSISESGWDVPFCVFSNSTLQHGC